MDNQEEAVAVQFPADNMRSRTAPIHKLELDAKMRDVSNPYAAVDARVQTSTNGYRQAMLQLARARQGAFGLKPR